MRPRLMVMLLAVACLVGFRIGSGSPAIAAGSQTGTSTPSTPTPPPVPTLPPRTCKGCGSPMVHAYPGLYHRVHGRWVATRTLHQGDSGLFTLKVRIDNPPGPTPRAHLRLRRLLGQGRNAQYDGTMGVDCQWIGCGSGIHERTNTLGASRLRWREGMPSMIVFIARSLILAVVLALVPTFTSAGGVPPSPLGGGTSACAHRTAYEVQMISSAGPFAPRNDPFIKRPLVPKLTYNVLNTGASMPHLVISLDSRGTFVPGRVSATLNTGHGLQWPRILLIAHTGSVYEWDFAAFPAGAEELIHIQMHLKRQCCYSASVRAFGNLTSYGTPDPTSAVSGGASGGSGVVSG